MLTPNTQHTTAMCLRQCTCHFPCSCMQDAARHGLLHIDWQTGNLHHCNLVAFEALVARFRSQTGMQSLKLTLTLLTRLPRFAQSLPCMQCELCPLYLPGVRLTDLHHTHSSFALNMAHDLPDIHFASYGEELMSSHVSDLRTPTAYFPEILCVWCLTSGATCLHADSPKHAYREGLIGVAIQRAAFIYVVLHHQRQQ